MKHSPIIRLQATRRALDAARLDCPHWDYESERGDTVHDCCIAVDEAKNAHRLALRAYNAKES